MRAEMAAVGGVGTILGPVTGVLIVYYGIQTQLESNPELSSILTGVLLVAIVRFAPEGVWGLVARTARQRVLRSTPQPPPALDREVNA